MIAVTLALVGAVAYGVSDFVGGIFGRRAGAWAVAFAGALGGGTIALVAALTHPVGPGSSALAWGAVAGLGNGFGTAFLYRGLSSGRMGVVAPVSGVLAVVLPVVAGVTGGERPALLAWLGIAASLPAIWLVARPPSEPAPATSSAAGSGVVDGVLAGLGFGALFAALGQVPSSAGFWPLVLNQAVALVVIAGVATALHTTFVPRGPAWGGALAGSMGGMATLSFLIATHHGLLSVSAVLTSLYPAVTIVLAAIVLREHVHRVQAAGLALCAVSVVLVATG